MFPNRQCIQIVQNPHVAKRRKNVVVSDLIRAIGSSLFSSPTSVMELCQYWLQLPLLAHASTISFLRSFSRNILLSNIHFSLSHSTFNIFTDSKFAIPFSAHNPFRIDLINCILLDAARLFRDIHTSHEQIHAKQFRFNDLLERSIDRWGILEWLFYHLLLSHSSQIFRLKDVLFCVIRDLNKVHIDDNRHLPSPPGIINLKSRPTQRLYDIVVAFKTW